MKRCLWGTKSLNEQKYHDEVWGKPVHDDETLFKMLILEGQQAGLSWSTILNKIPAFEIAYDHFDPEKIASWNETKVEELLQNEKIIRNRLKIKAAITNAQAFLKLKSEVGEFNQYLWSFVQNQPIVNEWTDFKQVPATTPISDSLSLDLKRRGFKFIGSTIIYAYMQAIGMVNDHIIDCDFR